MNMKEIDVVLVKKWIDVVLLYHNCQYAGHQQLETEFYFIGRRSLIYNISYIALRNCELWMRQIRIGIDIDIDIVS